MNKKGALVVLISVITLCTVVVLTATQVKGGSNDEPVVKEGDKIKESGMLVYRELPRTKSVEAYLGEEFFLVLKDESEIVLWPTEKVDWDTLYNFSGLKVGIEGYYVEGERPDDPYGSYPLDFDGLPMKRGAGYMVTKIKPLKF